MPNSSFKYAQVGLTKDGKNQVIQGTSVKKVFKKRKTALHYATRINARLRCKGLALT